MLGYSKILNHKFSDFFSDIFVELNFFPIKRNDDDMEFEKLTYTFKMYVGTDVKQEKPFEKISEEEKKNINYIILSSIVHEEDKSKEYEMELTVPLTYFDVTCGSSGYVLSIMLPIFEKTSINIPIVSTDAYDSIDVLNDDIIALYNYKNLEEYKDKYNYKIHFKNA